jgi:nucleoside phosphorylase
MARVGAGGVMLIWVCALHCEAKPVIDFYRLKKSQDQHAFDIYRGDDMVCVVSGIGKIASAAACAWIAASYSGETSFAWINLGTAGGAEHEIGELLQLNQVVDADSGQCYYPAPVAVSPLAGSACLTLSRPSEDYRSDTLFDMEASGFMQSALRFSSAELVQGLKIVSDNRKQQTGKDRQRVSELIHRHIDSIHHQADALLQLDRELAALEPAADSWQQVLSLAHFSQTQKSRLRVLWRYLCNRDFSSDTLLRQLATQNSARAILDTLEQISFRDSEGL